MMRILTIYFLYTTVFTSSLAGRDLTDGTCVIYCDIVPDNRALCPETPETRPPNRVDTTDRLADLRTSMATDEHTGQSGSLSAYLVYEESFYGGGKVSDYDRRVQWISGFSGSSGHAVVTRGDGQIPDRAALWVDGRYFIQADNEMDCNWIMMQDGVTGTPTGPQWLVDILPTNALVGADPAYMDTSIWQDYEKAFEVSAKNITLVAVPDDLFLYSWTAEEGRPPIANNEIYIHNITYAGVPWEQKLASIREVVTPKADVLIVTLLDDIAWLFNLRGSDRETSPLFDSIAMIFEGEIRLYLRDHLRLISPNSIHDHLNTNVDGTCSGQPDCVRVLDYEQVLRDLEDFQTNPGIDRVWINIGGSYAIYSAVGDKRLEEYSPVQLPKSHKNSVEQTKYRECQVRDSAHLVEFLAMLEPQVKAGVDWTELSASQTLLEYRKRDPAFKMVSFVTIAGMGPNGAIIHYQPSNSTDRPVTTTEMFLLDSGGNYLDGTTDITRTFHYGEPTDKEKEAYTRVLLGVIELATTVWPFGWKGSDIDARTRNPIWQHGWDFNHVSGHGLGYFLSVSEGPGMIEIGYNPSHEALHEHMFFSDEPGVYVMGEFGVRLESEVEVVRANTSYAFEDKVFLTFDIVSFVPFEPNLIKYELLDISHRQWLNAYHAKCEEMTGQYLLNIAGNQEAYDWLTARTAAIPETPNFSSAGVPVYQVTLWAISLAVWADVCQLVQF